MTTETPSTDIWSAPCVCGHLFADHWFDMTRPAGEPDTGCHECACSGFQIAPAPAAAGEEGGRAVKVYVRRLDTREVVQEIEVGQPSAHNHEKFMRGLLRNMNTEEFYVDDSEVKL